MSKDVNDPIAVSAFINKLDPSFAKMIETIRQLILKSDKQVGEQIKWNSPAFFYTGEIKPFDPKEYRRDIVVIHTRKNIALLVFPTGAVIDDSSGILEGEYKDGRRMITFKTIDEVNKKGKDLQKVIKKWLEKVE